MTYKHKLELQESLYLSIEVSLLDQSDQEKKNMR